MAGIQVDEMRVAPHALVEMLATDCAAQVRNEAGILAFRHAAVEGLGFGFQVVVDAIHCLLPDVTVLRSV